jgi:large subunit ribosomal protein L15
VNLDRISELFPEGGAITVADLVAKGAVRDGHPVKVLGTGDITVAVQVTADAFSGSAKEKIEAAGGSATVA